MRRYFISGGTGFIGREIVRQLCERRETETIVCLTRGHRMKENLIHHEKVRYWLGDITSCDFPDEPFTDIIHGANEANDLLQPDQDRYYYTIVEGTKRIHDWYREKHFRSRFLLLSSGAIYKGDTVYARGKAMAEHICKYSATIARIYSVIGEEMPLDGQYAAGRFFGQAKRGEVKYYDAGFLRSYLHIEDCARWLIQILDNAGVRLIYDVGSLNLVPVTELAKKIASAMGVPAVECVREAPHPTAQVYGPIAERIAPYCEQTITLDQAIKRVACSLA